MGCAADLKRHLDSSNLEDKCVLITGGASGLGAFIATAFAEQGAYVTIADINAQQGQRFIAKSAFDGDHIQLAVTDVTDWMSQVQAFKSAIAFAGHDSIDVVVAAAGLGGSNFTFQQEQSPSLEEDPPPPPHAGPTFDVNAKGVYFTSKLAQHYFALPHSLKDYSATGLRKSLILISSMAGYLELNAADYTASKWAVRGLFRSIRSKMEDLDYRVNLVAPWVMETPMSKPLADICRKSGFPIGDAQNVADAVIRCAADDTICGRAIAVGAAETFDLGDDAGGLNAGLVMKGYLEGEARDFMAFFGQRP